MTLIQSITQGIDTRTICVPRVRRKHINGSMSGSTAKDVSPTSPRVTLFTASWSKCSPRRGATGSVSLIQRGSGKLHTVN